MKITFKSALATVAFLAAVAGCSANTDEKSPSASPTSAIPSASSSPAALAPDEVAYEPRVFNTCGLASDADAAFVLGCGAEPGEHLRVSSTGVQVPEQSGSATAGTHKVGNFVFVVGEAGIAPDRRGQALVIDASTGSVVKVDLGMVRPTASAPGLGGIVIGTQSGDVLALAPEGSVRSVGSAGKEPLGIAVDGERVWIVNKDGSAGWFSSDDPGRLLRVGHVERPSRTGVAVVDHQLWVLSKGTQISRFSSNSALAPRDLSGRALSLVSCGSNAWIRFDDASAKLGVVSFNKDFKEQATWMPSQFPGYISCAGAGVWGVTADGHLLRSPE